MTKSVSSFINGMQIDSQDCCSIPVISPRSGKILRYINCASDQEISNCIQSAEAGFRIWSNFLPVKRAEILFKYLKLLDQYKVELAKIIVDEHGKILSDAIAEVDRGIEVVQYACGVQHLLKGDYSENVGHKIDSFSIRQAVGVVVGITPFNFPAMVPMWMFPIALACGNSFILKPSEHVPTVALRLAELLTEAGCPNGVFNVLLGSKEIVDALLESDKVKAISFVGSTAVAKMIYTKGTSYGKRVQALGGAKNHAVIMPDANLNVVRDALMSAAFGAAGERCMAISVAVVIGDNNADQLVKMLSTAIKSLKVGIKADDDMGPLISAEHKARVIQYIESGLDQGASLLVDGRNIEFNNDGYFIGGSLFDHVTVSYTHLTLPTKA